MKKKALLQNRGCEIGAAVADGAAEIGVTFISELLPNRGPQGGRAVSGSRSALWCLMWRAFSQASRQAVRRAR